MIVVNDKAKRPHRYFGTPRSSISFRDDPINRITREKGLITRKGQNASFKQINLVTREYAHALIWAIKK